MYTRAALALLVTLLLASIGCNRIDAADAGAADGGDAADAVAVAVAATDAERPEGSDVTSLAPGAETRIYYQFIDERGAVRFVERLDDVPEAWRDRVGYLELDSPPPLAPADAQRVRDARYERANPGGTRLASSTQGRAMDRFEHEILLYYADWCGYCKKAKRHLDGKGVDYELLDVDIPANKSEMVEKTGQRGIPVIEVDGRIMKGYNARRLDELLDAV